MSAAAIFGGCGFIGLFYAEELIKVKNFGLVYLLDLEKPFDIFLNKKFLLLEKSQKLKFIKFDVRQNLTQLSIQNVDIIADFAAIHREPGHLDHEYFDTNVNGSNNICNFAKQVNCQNITFTSSISVYGDGDYEKNETTKLTPSSAYGKSKLECEKNYINWQREDSNKRILTICRPGVVFGAGEKGNVTRLIKVVKKKLFFYMGNKKLKKAGIYIKELVNILMWVNHKQIDKQFNNIEYMNATFSPCPDLNDYVKSVCNQYNISSNFLSIPKKLILFIIFITSFVTKKLKSTNNYNYIRLNKLFRSNFIKPRFLLNNKYSFKYNLNSSMVDWKKDNPDDWK